MAGSVGDDVGDIRTLVPSDECEVLRPGGVGIDCEILDVQGHPYIALLDGDELDSHLEENDPERGKDTESE